MHLNYRKRILVSFCVATVVLISVGLSSYLSYSKMSRQKDLVDHTYEVIGIIENIFSDVVDIQSSQRGYVITGLEDYMAPYYAALPRIQKNLHQLGRLIVDNPQQVNRYTELQTHVAQRLEIAAHIVSVYHDSGQAIAIAEIKKGAGKREMEQIRAIVDDMIAEEHHLLNERRKAMVLSSEVTTAAGLSGLAICFMILATVFALIKREADQRAGTEASLQKALTSMEHITNETKLIGKLGDYLRGCRTEEEAYSIIERNMPLLFPYTYGSISIINNSRNLLTAVLHWGEKQYISGDFEPEHCWALRQGRIHVPTADRSVPLCQHLSGMDEQAISICLPMQAQGETLGQIFLGTFDRRVLQEHQIDTLKTVGEQISLALANLSLQRALREQSIKDPLTKLFNRRYLEETLTREVARAQRAGQPLAVLIMDIDFFKKVNDTYGHDGGDAVLVSFAKLLGTKIRKEDIACRLGGEEFVLVLPAAGQELAIARAEEIGDITRKTKITFQGKVIGVTVSIGIAMMPDHGTTPDELIQHADLALYRAKREGRDRSILYDGAAAETLS